ncbi:ArsR/SmtB family transcription factor [Alkalihalobacillus trypoxylicola]|uniref:ArsR family transcriptional regulator n=1 Tax=Alkalihalobacillus trypoxylicola TaxID=519424 RepID=A0A162E7F4_9BACI|nr:metalloregulator ArsR/SmtB family transcription factor [Alkalihalobacillus trypoxylicola]KYG31959.1 ArsR family transcriptional regulator [Alkalihalobacillus trypoxylicola]GAF65817.1 putative transcriptional regulator [Bacillus sp. TS-2]
MSSKIKKNPDVCEVFQYDEKKVKRVSSVIEKEDMVPVAAIFKALSDPTRMKITYALVLEDELCVCDIAHIIQATIATTSHHLRLLKNLGIAKSRKEGKLVFYSIDDHHITHLVQTGLIHSKEDRGK